MKDVNIPTFTLIVGCGMFLSTLDSGIISVALPSLAKAFATNLNQIVWTITIYTLTLSISILVFGHLADQHGRLRIYKIGLLCFVISSFFCGTAMKIDFLIVARATQGLSAAMLQATSIALVSTRLSGKKQASAMSIMGMMIGLGPIMGPTLGGIIISYIGWRWIFFLNIPICIMALYSCKFLPKSQEIKAKNPLVNLQIFTNTRFIALLLTIMSFGGATTMAFVLPPLYFEKIRHLQTWQTGLLCFTSPTGIVIASKLLGNIIHSHGLLKPIMAGLLIMIASLLVLTFLTKNWAIFMFVLLLFVYGLGGGLFQSSCYLLMLSLFSESKHAYVSSVIRMLQNIAIAGQTMVASYFIKNRTHLLFAIRDSWLISAMLMMGALLTLMVVIFIRKENG